MIKPIELYHNGLYLFDNMNIRVAFEDDEINIYDLEKEPIPTVIQLSKLSGIPLTPEWLEKLGFINNPVFYYWGRQEVSIDYKPRGKTFWYHENSHTIKRVHQLQALYHSLTGQELTIKQ